MRDSTSPTLVSGPIVHDFLSFKLTRDCEADAILNSNLHIPLRGAAIGNGWIDAKTQYPSYLDYAVKHGIVEANSDVSPSCKPTLCAYYGN